MTVKFSVGPVNSPSDKKKNYGPVPVFIDLCTVKETAGNVNIRILSNTVAGLVTIRQPSPFDALTPTEPR